MEKKIKEAMKGAKKVAHKKEVGEKRIKKILGGHAGAFKHGEEPTAKKFREHVSRPHKKVQEELNRGKRREKRLKEGKKV